MATAFSFIHCADLHLDSPFEGLHALEPRIARVLREATFRAFENIIDLALREGVDFLVVAGDVYDGADRSLQAQWRFREALRRAAAAGIRCFVAHGNHDPLSGWEANLEMPEEVQRFGGQEVQQWTVAKPGAVLAHIYGVSYPIREVRENLVPRFPRPPEGAFAIGVLHCNVGGNPHHDNYAPCSLEDLLTCRLDYWALGHVHARQILREQDPCIVYPGNTQGRNIRESGAKGCYLVRVGEARRVTLEFVATDVLRWFVRDLDIAGLGSLDDLLVALEQVREEVRREAGGRAALLRLNLTGRGELHPELRRLDLEAEALRLREGETDRPDFVWVESLANRTRPALDLAPRRQVQDFVGDFLCAAEECRGGEDPAARLRELLTRRPEHRVIARELEALSEPDLQALLGDAETLGVDLLLPEDS